jgi:DNA-binding MarR family transcriptional regulator
VEVVAAVSAEDSMRLIESALAIIVAWASRREFQEEAMRRARCNLTRAHAALLGRLSELGPLRTGELAAMLGIDNSTITPQVQKLARARLIAREPDPKDGRAAMLTITAEGQQLLERLHRTRREMLLEKLRDWTPSDRAAVAAALSRLASSL